MKLSAIQTSTRVSSKYVRQALLIIAFLSSVFAYFGCQHIGPKTIVDDRLAYNKAALTSWEQQTLLNLVRVRYRDLVSFVDVGSVIQAHSLQGSVTGNVGATLNPWNIVTSTLSPSLMGSRTTMDSPSVTYTPQTTPEFTRNLNAPINPIDICNLIESGYDSRLLLNLTLYSINEITTAASPSASFLNLRSTSSRTFVDLTKAIHCALWHRGDLNFYVQPATDPKDAKLFMIVRDKDSEEACENGPPRPIDYIREKLHLRAAATQFQIVVGSHPTNEDEIAVRTRSVIAAMIWLSNYVDAPPGAPEIADLAVSKKLLDKQGVLPLKVGYQTNKPRNAFAAVQYKGYWFSIPDDDRNSKSSLIYLRILLALADTGPKPPPPVLTFPVR